MWKTCSVLLFPIKPHFLFVPTHEAFYYYCKCLFQACYCAAFPLFFFFSAIWKSVFLQKNSYILLISLPHIKWFTLMHISTSERLLCIYLVIFVVPPGFFCIYQTRRYGCAMFLKISAMSRILLQSVSPLRQCGILSVFFCLLRLNHFLCMSGPP